MIKEDFFIDYSRCIGCEACVQASANATLTAVSQ